MFYASLTLDMFLKNGKTPFLLDPCAPNFNSQFIGNLRQTKFCDFYSRMGFSIFKIQSISVCQVDMKT